MSEKNEKLPPRENIKEELAKVSNFTEDELSVLNWSSMYKAYSLIVRYGEKNVEDTFRKEEWFQNAVKEAQQNKAAGLPIQPMKEENLDEKELKKREKENRKLEKEARKKERKEEKERKRRIKDFKKDFEDKEFSITEFYGFLNELAKNKEFQYDLQLIDKALIQVKKNQNPYINIFIKDGKISFKRGKLETL